MYLNIWIFATLWDYSEVRYFHTAFTWQSMVQFENCLYLAVHGDYCKLSLPGRASCSLNYIIIWQSMVHFLFLVYLADHGKFCQQYLPGRAWWSFQTQFSWLGPIPPHTLSVLRLGPPAAPCSRKTWKENYIIYFVYFRVIFSRKAYHMWTNRKKENSMQIFRSGSSVQDSKWNCSGP